ncbi:MULTISPECIES: hypothetical protein [Paraburkholderia]|nr:MULTISPECIES: hypothetical protein [Paraburkholderia]
MRAERPYGDHEAHHRRSYLYAFATVAVFVSVFAGYVLSHRHAGETASETQVTQGAVAGTPPAPMPSPVAVPMPPAQTAQTAAAPVPPPRHAAASHTETAPPGAASLKSLRDERAVAMKRDASLRADVSRNLAGARASLDKNNLGPARRSIMSALAEQPGNGEALQMQSELLAREQDRDLLLGSARLCARQADWVCAWHNAGRALTVDASSSEARDLLSRAMAEQSAKGQREFDPSLDSQ